MINPAVPTTSEKEILAWFLTKPAFPEFQAANF
jgi:hypothetical protein